MRTPSMTHCPRVLVVDGDPRWLRLLGGYLSRFYDVRVASDGSSAVQCVAREDIDVVIAGVHLGTMDGTELHRAVQRLCPGLEERIVFVTEIAELQSLAPSLLETGATVLVKQLDISRFRGEVERVMETQCSGVRRVLGEEEAEAILEAQEEDEARLVASARRTPLPSTG